MRLANSLRYPDSRDFQLIFLVTSWSMSHLQAMTSPPSERASIRS